MAFIFAQNNSIAPVEMAKVELELPAAETNQIRKKEKWQHILREILIPFIIAGIGMVAAGILFDIVETWDLFQFVTALITLIPALLDLKGNIEMTLASRLSTQMHVKKIHDSKTKIRAALGNIAIIQLQAIVIGFLASFVACLLDFILHQQFVPKYLLILIGSSVATASFSAFIIGGIIIVIILVSSKFNINPDNIATPIASSLGDLVSLSILAGFGTFLFVYRDNIWIHITILSLFLLSIPFLAYYCYTNEFVKEVLFYGWVPNLVSMLISCFAGVILETGLKTYPGIKIYQPIVNGLGGNLVAIYASRMSTQMHLDSEMGKWCLWAPKRFYLYPKETFLSEKNPEDVVARILVLLALPSHLVFFFIIYFIDITLVDSSVKYLDASLVILYLIVAITQVILLITICFAMSHIAWRLNRNPDNVCIPVMTSLGDFLGCAFLFLCFHLSYVLGNEKVFIDAYQQTESISTTIFSTIFDFYNH